MDSHAPCPKAPSYQHAKKLLRPSTYAHTAWETVTTFSRWSNYIKGNFLHDRPRHLPWRKILTTRDLFAVASVLVCSSSRRQKTIWQVQVQVPELQVQVQVQVPSTTSLQWVLNLVSFWHLFCVWLIVLAPSGILLHWKLTASDIVVVRRSKADDIRTWTTLNRCLSVELTTTQLTVLPRMSMFLKKFPMITLKYLTRADTRDLFVILTTTRPVIHHDVTARRTR